MIAKERSGSERRLPTYLSVGVLLIVIGILVLPSIAILFRQPIVNSDPVRAGIAELTQRLIGRHVTIEGKILINDFPWITIVIGPGTVDNPPDFKGPPLLRWQRITAQVHYSTLYEPEPLLGPVIIEGLEAEPRIDQSGRDNFSDLGPLEDTGPPQARLVIPRIELRNARLRYTDESISDSPLVSFDNLNLALEDLRRGAGPIDSQRVNMASLKIDGQLTTSSEIGVVAKGAMQTTLSAITLSISEDAAQSIDIDEMAIGFGTFRADLKDIFANPSSMSASLVVQPAPIDALMISAGFTPPFRSAPDLLQLRGLSAKLSYSDKVLRVESLNLQIDETRVSGGIRLRDPVEISIDIDKIDFERYATAFGGGGRYDPEAPLIFPGKLLQDLPLDGRIRFGRINARGANLVGVSLSLESSPTRARNPR